MRRALRGALIALFWLGVWALAAYAVSRPLLLPNPVMTFETMLSLMRTGEFWQTAGMTLLRVLIGYLSAVLLGTALGALCHFVPICGALLNPLRQIVRATPVSSFIILVLLWIRIGAVPAFISFLMVLPIIWTSVQEGLSAADRQLIEMAEAYHFTAFRKARYLYAPSVLPHFSAGCVTGLGFAWKSGIAAEVIARPNFAIGSSLQDAKIYLETPTLFAWTALVILLSMALERLLVSGMRKIGGGSKR